MAKNKPTPRPMLQGRTDSPAFAGRIRTPQQGPNAAMAKALGTVMPLGLPVAMVKRKERGRR
jgi:hypothetical protein